MGEYKFLGSKYIDCLLGGEIHFRRLIYYRLLEVVTQDQWIGDASEGVARATIDHVLISPATPNPTLRRRLEEAALVKMTDDSTVEMTNVTFSAEVDCFVFCFSSGDLTQLTETMCAPDRPEYAYDGCVSILDPTVLAKAIYDSGKLDGRPIRDNFSVTVGPVGYYEPVAQDFLTGGMPSADPFKKDRRYAVQQEMRIVLIPRNPIESDSATVIVDKPDTLFREEFRSRLIGKKVAVSRPHDKRSIPDLFKVLADALRIWEDFPRVAACSNVNEREALQKRNDDERTSAFDSHRSGLVQAYWTLRQTYPDTQMDRDIARSAKAFVLRNHLRNYLMKHGSGRAAS